MIFIVFIACSFLYLPVKAQSQTIIVPDNFPTITAAVLNANNGDTVFVKNGNYTESIEIDKPISLIGEERNSVVITAPFSTIFGSQTIKVVADEVKISNLTVNNYNDYGFGISDSGNRSKIISNIVYAQTAIVTSAPFIIVSKNNLSGSTSVLVSTHDCNITDNILSSSIDLEGSFNIVSENRITGNTVYGIVGYGVFINGNSNNVTNNTIVNEQDGISVFAGSDNTIIKNIVVNCIDNGLRVDDGSANFLLENNVSDCGHGVSMGLKANNNTIYHNNFMNNIQQVSMQPNVSEYWNNSNEGNYWSDYSERYPNAKEVDDLGIWNMPYVIDVNNVDNYPLLLQYGASSKLREQPFPWLPVTAAVLVVVAVVTVAALAHFKKNKHKAESASR